MKKIIFLLFAFYLIFFTPTALAACGPNQEETDIGCITKLDPNASPAGNALGFTSDIYGIGLGFIGAVALISILIGAYQILTSQGDPTKLANGKSYIVYAIIGLVLAIGGFAFYRIIAANVLQIPGFK